MSIQRYDSEWDARLSARQPVNDNSAEGARVQQRIDEMYGDRLPAGVACIAIVTISAALWTAILMAAW